MRLPRGMLGDSGLCLQQQSVNMESCAAQSLAGELLPVFSQSKVNDCFADIMVPSWTNYDAVGDAAHGEGAVPWEARAPSLFFRGSSTGGFVGDDTPFASMHRQRLVALAANQSRMDVAFVEYVQCSPAACAAMEARCALPCAG